MRAEVAADGSSFAWTSIVAAKAARRMRGLGIRFIGKVGLESSFLVDGE
jgi:hypothetical protein